MYIHFLWEGYVSPTKNLSIGRNMKNWALGENQLDLDELTLGIHKEGVHASPLRNGRILTFFAISTAF